MRRNEREDYRGLGIVLSGTKYGEADRILNILLETGEQVGVLAKGVRRSRSKLAGGTQMLAVNRVEIHFSKKGGLAVLTGAGMVEFYGGILTEALRLEMAHDFFTKFRKLSDVEEPKLFTILRSALLALGGKQYSVPLIRFWFQMNLAVLLGEINSLYYDTSGERLKLNKVYSWSPDEKGFYESKNGKFSSEMIKFLRVVAENDIPAVVKIKDWEEYLQKMPQLW